MVECYEVISDCEHRSLQPLALRSHIRRHFATTGANRPIGASTYRWGGASFGYHQPTRSPAEALDGALRLGLRQLALEILDPSLSGGELVAQQQWRTRLLALVTSFPPPEAKSQRRSTGTQVGTRGYYVVTGNYIASSTDWNNALNALILLVSPAGLEPATP
jgi:hypothetical protein